MLWGHYRLYTEQVGECYNGREQKFFSKEFNGPPFTFSNLGVGDHQINLRPNTTVAQSLGCARRVGRSVTFTIV